MQSKYEYFEHIDGQTLFQVPKEYFDLVVSAATGTAKTTLKSQRKVELNAYKLGWRFAKDYKYSGNTGRLSMICPLGFPFVASPHTFLYQKNNQMPNGYWTKERCHFLAKKCTKKTQFKDNYFAAYKAAYKQDWLDEICEHMEERTPSQRCVYLIENHTLKEFYIGLTNSFNKRKRDHFSGKHKATEQLTKHPDTKISIVLDYIDEAKAAEFEQELITEWSSMADYILLNDPSKGGTLGGNTVKWTKVKVREEAVKYNKKSDFSRQSKGAYNAGLQFGRAFFLVVTSHMDKNSRSQFVYVTPKGTFNFPQEAANENNVSPTTVRKRCKKADSLIKATGGSIPKEWVGKTWRQVGWWLEDKSDID